MSDDKEKKHDDRRTIDRNDSNEVSHVARKFSITNDKVIEAIEKVGNKRTNVYAELEG